MKMTRIGQLVQLAFMPRLFPVNCYLVEEGDGLTLIDAAMPFSAKGILDAAMQLGKPITRIALTHAHGDHIGALDKLKEQLPDAKVYISARDARLLRGDRSLDANEPQMAIRGGIPKPNAIQTKPDVELNDGDRVGSLQVIATPGHTPGSVSYFDTRSGALIAGDALQTRGGLTVSGKVQPLFPFPAMATWSKEKSVESAQRIHDVQPSLLAVGHGKMVSQPAQALADAIKAAARALQ
ncbi:MBL fold metallo-hydrolase [Paenibacillus sp. MMS18-CY102]|uniref:MBL fold metallo-hydrolase n=1 Tax=Paenibacillus sp. MMS18-CY102 TaxID=2682849 RepID=UPI001365725B|nr:MBL fold metallo-hydrolase [Paenibacillus sp. MMS18-CY102]MWC27933.1 MBL fold metallo-hydrolase [Paenibacillus sp. MMS18-CY102]